MIVETTNNFDNTKESLKQLANPSKTLIEVYNEFATKVNGKKIEV